MDPKDEAYQHPGSMDISDKADPLESDKNQLKIIMIFFE